MDLDLTLDLQEFRLPAPKELSDNDREGLVRGSMSRIWEGAKELAPHGHGYSESLGEPSTDLWMLLIVRLVTRVSEPPPDEPPDEGDGQPNGESTSYIVAHQDRLRQTLCEYIIDDFPGRYVRSILMDLTADA